MAVVLIVDDEAMIRDLATRILTKHNYIVIAKETAGAALDALAEQGAEIAVAILDYTLPGMSGIDLLRKMREIRTGLPCIISSGHPLTPDDLPADMLSQVSFLQKPYRSAQLLEAVQKVTARTEPA